MILHAALAEAAQPSWAGILGAFAGVVTALAVLIGSVTVLIPVLRAARRTEAKVNAVHKLVDGNLTAAKVDQLDAMRRDLVSLQEVSRLHREAGRDPNPDAVAEIDHTRLRIAELYTEITERRARDEAVRASA